MLLGGPDLDLAFALALPLVAVVFALAFFFGAYF